ncbi:MAG TPA: hypothetical protein VGJ74_21485 [Burkholderiales bacterium]|jgi:hypothetical protein
MNQTASAREINVHTESRWIGAGPAPRSSKIQNEESATATISATHVRPSSLWVAVPLRRASTAMPSAKASIALRDAR